METGIYITDIVQVNTPTRQSPAKEGEENFAHRDKITLQRIKRTEQWPLASVLLYFELWTRDERRFRSLCLSLAGRKWNVLMERVDGDNHFANKHTFVLCCHPQSIETISPFFYHHYLIKVDCDNRFQLQRNPINTYPWLPYIIPSLAFFRRGHNLCNSAKSMAVGG